jgi:hypothetical protein
VPFCAERVTKQKNKHFNKNMQDEIIKHTKKVHKELKNTKHTFGEKIKEIIVEIFIIVFAVTFSIWLHSWSEHRHEQEEANKFLVGLKDDLKKDIEVLEENKENSTIMVSHCEFLQNVTKTQSDTIIGPHTTFADYNSFYNSGRYEGFKSSGKIGTIESDSLRNAILFYYQQTIPKINSKIDLISFFQLEGLKDFNNSPDNMSLFSYYSRRKTKSTLNNLNYNYKASISTFEKAINEAKNIIAEIDKENKE